VIDEIKETTEEGIKYKKEWSICERNEENVKDASKEETGERKKWTIEKDLRTKVIGKEKYFVS
jgi:hypothetical protein